MPLYGYECEEHGGYEDWMPMSECNSGKCPKCGKVGRRLFDKFHTYIDFRAGFDVSLDRYIDTKRQRDEILREKGWTRYKD
jgi:putative FmdB family regulatory protein